MYTTAQILRSHLDAALAARNTAGKALKKMVRAHSAVAPKEPVYGKVAVDCLEAADQEVAIMLEATDAALSTLHGHHYEGLTKSIQNLHCKMQDATTWLASHKRCWLLQKLRRRRFEGLLVSGKGELSAELHVLAVRVATSEVAGNICADVMTAIEPLSRAKAVLDPKFSARIVNVLDGAREAIGAAMALSASATMESLKMPLVKLQEAGMALFDFLKAYKKGLWLLHRADTIRAITNVVGIVLSVMGSAVDMAGHVLTAMGHPAAPVLHVFAMSLKCAASATPKTTALILSLMRNGVTANAGTETAQQLAMLVDEFEQSLPRITDGIQGLQ
ncbi:hypothetical protein HK405_007269 [Cladochytrium tenue]|nr:hypothetical protein HK405_007269 [Cladochytrium tenue]